MALRAGQLRRRSSRCQPTIVELEARMACGSYPPGSGGARYWNGTQESNRPGAIQPHMHPASAIPVRIAG